MKYLISGLTADASYDVQVRAVNSDGDGAWSGTATGIPRKIPGAPTSVSVDYGDEELTVTWSAPTGDAPISGYDISYRESPSGGWNTEQFGGALHTLEHTISNLDNGQAYNVKVRALNVAGEGPWADFPNTVTPKTVPDAPIISGTAGNAKITLTWTTPDNGGADIYRYDLRYVRSDVPDADKDTRSTIEQTIGSRTTLSYVLSGLENGKSYDVQILARNNVGPSDWSNTVVETPRTIPSAPVISTIVNSAIHGDAILTVSWTAGSDGGAEITSYDLRYIRNDAENKADTEWTEVSIWTSGDGALEYRLGGLTKGVEYYIEVRGVNIAGDGGWSTTYKQTPKTAPAAPGTPSLGPGSEELTVTWHSPGDTPDATGGVDITGYDIRYIESDTTHANKVVDSNWTEETFPGLLSTLEHTIDGLTNGTEYDVQVRAVNPEGDGLWSKTRKGTPRTIPGAPTLNTLAPGDRSLTLAWTAPDTGGADITRYDLQFKESDDEDIPANWDEVSPIWASGDLEYEFKLLTNGTSYDIQVRAHNEAGEGPWSTSQSGTPRTKPGAPTIGSVTLRAMTPT